MPLDIAQAKRLLAGHRPFDSDEAGFIETFRSFLETVDSVSGVGFKGRLTAAGWVIDRACGKVLLIRNQKLKLWLNPGGKYEPEDGTLSATMQREVRQESGIMAQPDAPLFDISYIGLDYNPQLKLPMFDFRFLVEADSTAPLQPHEPDKEPAWVSLTDVKMRMPDDIQNRRLLRRTEALFRL